MRGGWNIMEVYCVHYEKLIMKPTLKISRKFQKGDLRRGEIRKTNIRAKYNQTILYSSMEVSQGNPSLLTINICQFSLKRRSHGASETLELEVGIWRGIDPLTCAFGPVLGSGRELMLSLSKDVGVQEGSLVCVQYGRPSPKLIGGLVVVVLGGSGALRR